MSRTSVRTGVFVLLSGAVAVGCAGGGRVGAGDAAPAARDGGPVDRALADGGPEAASTADGRAGDGGENDGGAPGDGAGGGTGPSFILLVTESPPGPDNGNRANWGGVRAYFVRGDGAPVEAIDGIAASAVADPVALAFRTSSSEVFVSNRHGNNSADGVAGSLARFTFDARTRKLTARGIITGNGLAGVHQAAFDPVTGELFAANVKGGISRFTFDGQGNAIPNGFIPTAEARGVAVSPDGRRLYVSGATLALQQFELPSGLELARVVVGSGNTSLHYLTVRGTELFAAGLYDQTIHRLRVAASDGVTALAPVMGASNPVSVVFSVSGLEMFAVGHQQSHLLARFTTDASSATWTATASVDVPFSGGGALVLSGGAPAVVGPPGSRP